MNPACGEDSNQWLVGVSSNGVSGGVEVLNQSFSITQRTMTVIKQVIGPSFIELKCAIARRRVFGIVCPSILGVKG